MNLEDVVDPEYGLQQDDWSLTRPKFGEEGQLEVVGWSGKSYTNKYYILKCNKCSLDSELFGEGYFRSEKGKLLTGHVPCGCSKKTHWSKEQYSVLCSRKAKELGYTFLGFIGDWKGVHTKIKMLCEKHGEWTRGSIHTLTNGGNGCRGCQQDALVRATTKPDNIMIESFFKTGSFHPQTKFFRSEKKSKQGYMPYWLVSCPECGETGESASNSLQGGHRPCSCSKHRQQEAYINWLTDDHNNTVAIKFGIARDSKLRVKEQNLKSTYAIKQHSVYKFPDVASCKKAERECKQRLECGVVLKRDMPDGYTETTWLYNLEKVEEIYKRNGGLKERYDLYLQGRDIDGE